MIKCHPRPLFRSLNICFVIRTHEVQPAKTVQEFWFRRSYFSKKSKRNHLFASDILLFFIIHLRWCREVVSICIRHRHIKLVPSSQENMTIKFEFRAVVSRVIFYEFSSNNFLATFEAPSYHFSPEN